MGARTADAAVSAVPQGRVYAALLGQVAISAGTYLAGKRAMEELPPLTVVLWRLLLSGLIFTLLLWVTPGPKLPPRHERGRILLLGLLAGPVNQVLFFFGLRMSSAAHAALLYALTPLGVYCLALARGRERGSFRATLGILTALVGVVVLLLERGLASASGSILGDALIAAAVCAWVVYTTEGRPFAAEHGPMRATAWAMVAAALLSTPLMPFALQPVAAAQASLPAQACILYLAVLTSVVAYLLWYYALSHTDASKVAVFSNLQPPATALLAWALLGETLHWTLVVGGGLVLLGVRLTQLRPALAARRPAA